MPEVDLAVRGARVVTAEQEWEGDLYVAGGRVVALGRLPLSARETVDASGLLVLPGFVDAHVHFMDPGDPSREDFPTGSAAAAAAGVTCVVEHSHVHPVVDGPALEEKARYLADRSVVDFGLGAHFSPRGVPEVASAWQAGACFIKVFTCTTHGIEAVPWGMLQQAMEQLGPAGTIFLVHAEEDSLTRFAEARLRASGLRDGSVLPRWRSLLAEQLAVSTVCQLAAACRARTVVAHCSHPSVVDLVASASARGALLWAESCPQYLLLYEEEALRHGAFRKFTPPARARSPEDLEAMWERVRDGRVAYIASDHAPATRAQKEEGSIWDVHFGLPGIDTTSALLLDAALAGRISLQRLVQVYSAMPARLYGLYPRKGTLAVGSDADFVLVDPTARRTLADDAVLSRAGWTPYAGRTVQGAVVATYLRGLRVAENGRPVAPPGTGRFVPGPGKEARA